MGIMLILGVIVLGVLMAGRMSARQASSAPAAAPVVAPAVAPPVTVISTPVEPFAVNLNEPLGSQVVSIATIGDRLALHIVGGGSSRVLLVDPHDGRVLGRITLGE